MSKTKDPAGIQPHCGTSENKWAIKERGESRKKEEYHKEKKLCRATGTPRQTPQIGGGGRARGGEGVSPNLESKERSIAGKPQNFNDQANMPPNKMAQIKTERQNATRN